MVKQLQDLRGIAIIMVVLFHSGNQYTDLVSHGKNGVLLFFIISGFIISRVHGNDKGFADFSIFLRKRISRIYFPYWPILFFFIFAFFVTNKGAWYHYDTVNIIKNIFLIQKPSNSIHPYGWTLVFEMFYYFSFGFISMLLRVSLGGFMIIFSLPPLVNYVFSGGESSIITSVYNLYFIFGFYLGVYWRPMCLPRPKICLLAAFINFQMCPFITDNALLLLFSTVLFFFIYLNFPRNNLYLEKIGNASFSIYLVHAVIVVFSIQFFEESFLRFLLSFTVSILFGYAYYALTEYRLVKFGKVLLRLN